MSTTGGSTWIESKQMVPGYGQMVPGSIIIGGRNYDSPNQMVVFKTTDDGLSWQTFGLTSEIGCAYAMAVHPSNKSILYAGGSEIVSGAEMAALFKSTDAGSSWMRTDLTAKGGLRAIVFDSKDANRIYAGSSDGVLTSADGGKVWLKPTTAFYVYCLLADANTGMKVYAGTSNGVYATTNGGLSWTPMNTGLSSLQAQCLAFDPVHHFLFAGTIGGGVFRLSIATGVMDGSASGGIPQRFTIYPVHPNPFNASTHIRYDVPERANVRLDILDVNGKTVRILSDQVESPGEKTAVWNGTDGSGRPVPSGVYACRLVSKFGTTVRKMALQR